MNSNSSKRSDEVKLQFFVVYFSSLGVSVSSTSVETGKWTRNFYTVSEWKKKGPTHISDRFTKEGWEVQYKVLAMSPHT